MRLRFSLRTSLVLFTCLIVWLGFVARSARIHRAAMIAIDEAEGVLPPLETAAPAFLVNFLGPEFFCRIEKAELFYEKTTDEHLATLGKVPELKRIATNYISGMTIPLSSYLTADLDGGGDWFNDALISDAGLQSLAHADRLESLVLLNTSVTDDGVAHLIELPNLKSLALYSPYITDESVKHLASIKSLRRFLASVTSITPRGVERLQKALPECEIVVGSF